MNDMEHVQLTSVHIVDILPILLLTLWTEFINNTPNVSKYIIS